MRWFRKSRINHGRRARQAARQFPNNIMQDVSIPLRAGNEGVALVPDFCKGRQAARTMPAPPMAQWPGEASRPSPGSAGVTGLSRPRPRPHHSPFSILHSSFAWEGRPPCRPHGVGSPHGKRIMLSCDSWFCNYLGVFRKSPPAFFDLLKIHSPRVHRL